MLKRQNLEKGKAGAEQRRGKFQKNSPGLQTLALLARDKGNQLRITPKKRKSEEPQAPNEEREKKKKQKKWRTVKEGGGGVKGVGSAYLLNRGVRYPLKK